MREDEIVLFAKSGLSLIRRRPKFIGRLLARQLDDADWVAWLQSVVDRQVAVDYSARPLACAVLAAALLAAVLRCRWQAMSDAGRGAGVAAKRAVGSSGWRQTVCAARCGQAAVRRAVKNRKVGSALEERYAAERLLRGAVRRLLMREGCRLSRGYEVVNAATSRTRGGVM